MTSKEQSGASKQLRSCPFVQDHLCKTAKEISGPTGFESRWKISSSAAEVEARGICQAQISPDHFAEEGHNSADVWTVLATSCKHLSKLPSPKAKLKVSSQLELIVLPVDSHCRYLPVLPGLYTCLGMGGISLWGCLFWLYWPWREPEWVGQTSSSSAGCWTSEAIPTLV